MHTMRFYCVIAMLTCRVFLAEAGNDSSALTIEDAVKQWVPLYETGDLSSISHLLPKRLRERQEKVETAVKQLKEAHALLEQVLVSRYGVAKNGASYLSDAGVASDKHAASGERVQLIVKNKTREDEVWKLEVEMFRFSSNHELAESTVEEWQAEEENGFWKAWRSEMETKWLSSEFVEKQIVLLRKDLDLYQQAVVEVRNGKYPAVADVQKAYPKIYWKTK